LLGSTPVLWTRLQGDTLRGSNINHKQILAVDETDLLESVIASQPELVADSETLWEFTVWVEYLLDSGRLNVEEFQSPAPR
jgi:hypothetical protein